MKKNIEAEMDAGKPQDQSVAIAYDVMRRARKRKMAQGGLVDPEDPKIDSEQKITDHFPTYDTRKQKDPAGYSDSRRRVSSEEDDSRVEPDSLQESMVHKHPDDEEDRSNVLFDGKAERLDPLKKEYREDQSSIHMGRTDLEDDDSAADDIVSRIMRKMRRK